MWIFFAFCSALFAGITSILAKCGIKKTNSNVATAIRTIVVLIFSWMMVLVVGSLDGLFTLSIKTWLFLILSGMATGASWLCYFKALQIGNINKVVPIDKSSTILSMLFAFVLLGESISIIKFFCMIFIAAGTYLMISKKEECSESKNNLWFIFAVLSAVFASLTSILGKIGMQDVNSNLGTAIRTVVVLIMAWIVVFATGKQDEVKDTPKGELIFIILSGFATGASWLCYYKALQDGPASIVVPIDKLSIVVTIVFSYFVFKEKLNTKSFIGLIFIITGTLGLLL